MRGASPSVFTNTPTYEYYEPPGGAAPAYQGRVPLWMRDVAMYNRTNTNNMTENKEAAREAADERRAEEAKVRAAWKQLMAEYNARRKAKKAG